MQLSIELNAETDKVLSWLTAVRGQTPFALSNALNSTAFDLRKDFKAGTTTFFNAPTSFTQNAFEVVKSTKDNLEARVGPRDNRRYFSTQIQGGQRQTKGYERAIFAAAGLSATRQLVPTGVGLTKPDRFGNISRANVRKIVGLVNNGDIFVGKPRGGNRPEGVYRRSKGQLFPYFYMRTPGYQARYPMERIANQALQQVWQPNLVKAMQYALRSAR